MNQKAQKPEDNRIGDKVKIIKCVDDDTSSHDGKTGYIENTRGTELWINVGRVPDCYSPHKFINYSARGRKAHKAFMKTHFRGVNGKFYSLESLRKSASIKEQLTDKSKRCAYCEGAMRAAMQNTVYL